MWLYYYHNVDWCYIHFLSHYFPPFSLWLLQPCCCACGMFSFFPRQKYIPTFSFKCMYILKLSQARFAWQHFFKRFYFSLQKKKTFQLPILLVYPPLFFSLSASLFSWLFPLHNNSLCIPFLLFPFTLQTCSEKNPTELWNYMQTISRLIRREKKREREKNIKIIIIAIIILFCSSQSSLGISFNNFFLFPKFYDNMFFEVSTTKKSLEKWHRGQTKTEENSFRE